MKRFYGYFALAVLVLGLGFAGWTWLTLSFSYSKGERAGYVQKISQKGWVCKTWEGELAMVNLPGAMPQIFVFSVHDEAVAHQIEKNAGQRVSLSYEYHPGVPTTCFGDTQYYIVKVTPFVDSSASPMTQAPANPTGPATTPAAAPATHPTKK